MKPLTAKQLIEEINPGLIDRSLKVSPPKGVRLETPYQGRWLEDTMEELISDPSFKIANTEEAQKDLLRMLKISRDVEFGVIPDCFVYRGACRSCGPIMLDYPTSGPVVGCPWCSCPTGLKPRFQH